MSACFFFFSKPKIRGLFPYSDSILNLAHTPRAILPPMAAELKHLSFWGSDAWQHREQHSMRSTARPSALPAEGNRSRHNGATDEGEQSWRISYYAKLQRETVSNVKEMSAFAQNEKVSQAQIFSFDIHITL